VADLADVAYGPPIDPLAKDGIMNKKNIVALLALGYLLALAGCGGDQGQFVGLQSCGPDGSVVYFVKPNAAGKVDTSFVSPANCRH
jgi:hypothetical protein